MLLKSRSFQLTSTVVISISCLSIKDKIQALVGRVEEDLFILEGGGGGINLFSRK